MEKKINWADGLAFMVWLLPLIYLATIYPSLGPRLPLHFNASGNPDRYGSKAAFAGSVFIISGVGLGVGLLVRFLPLIDPKKKARYSQATFIRLSHALVFFIAVITFIFVFAGTQTHFTMPVKVFFPIMGLFFAYVGNLLNNIKPNYFVGIRTPWTLENEEVWRKTHRLAAKLWLPGGIILAILGWALTGVAAEVAFFTGLLIIVLAPVIYSYIYYRHLPK